MTRRSYEVCSQRDGEMPSKTPDNSFKSCLCTLLVVLAVCILLLVLSFTVRRFGSKNEAMKDEEDTHTNAQYGRGSTRTQQTNTTNRNISEENYSTQVNTNYIISIKSTTEQKQDVTSTGKESTTIENMNETFTTTTESQAMYQSDTDENSTTLTNKKQDITSTGKESTTTENMNETFTTTTESQAMYQSDTDENSTTLTNKKQDVTSTEKESTTTENMNETFTTTTESQAMYQSDTDENSTTLTNKKQDVTSTEKGSTSTENMNETFTTTTESQAMYQSDTDENSTTPTNKKQDVTSTEKESTTTENMNETFTTTTESQAMYQSDTDENSTTPTNKKQGNTSTGKESTTTENMNETFTTTTESQMLFHTTDADISTTFKSQKNKRFPIENEVADQSSLRSGINSSNGETCNNIKCQLTAARMFASMDFSKKPCENFYGYVCDKLSEYKEEEDINIFAPEILEAKDNPYFVNKFNVFYKSCLNHEYRFNYTDRIEKAKALLKTVGYFQTKGQASAISDLTEFLAQMILLKAMPLFNVDIDIDLHRSIYILKFLKPNRNALSLNHWSTFSEDQRKCKKIIEDNENGLTDDISEIHRRFLKCQQNYKDYLDAVETSVTEMGLLSGSIDRAELFGMRFFIEKEILRMNDAMHESVVREETLTRQYKSMRLQDLNEKFPEINWKKLLNVITNITVNETSEILLQDMEYFEDVFKVFSESSDSKSLYNAFLAVLVNKLYQNTVLPLHRYSRKKFCQEKTRELMPDIVNYIYKKQIPFEDNRKSNEYVKKLYNTLKKNFNDSLQNVSWLDEKSKISLEQKLDNIQLVMINVTNVSNEGNVLEKDYATLAMESNAYQFNLFNLMKFSRKRLFSLYGRNVTPENMYRNFVDASKSEAVFFYTSNFVCLPYGLTKKATEELPEYIILAQVGFPLAKIIGYSFDSIGMDNKIELQEEALVKFNDFVLDTKDTIGMAEPITFDSRKLNFSLNNELSKSERIAENTAMRLLEVSFTALDKTLLPWISANFNVDQTFFFAVTQEFCRRMSLMDFTIQAMESPVLPPQFRTYNILSNSKEFSKVFSCNPGSGMTTTNPVLPFPYLELEDNSLTE